MSKDLLPENVSLSNIHTLETDTAEAVTSQNISKTQILLAKEKKLREESQKIYQENKVTKTKSSFAMGVLIVVLLAASAGVFYYFYQRSQKPPVVIDNSKDSELVAYDSVKEINFSPEGFGDAAAISAKLYNSAIPDASGVTFFKTSPALKELLLIIATVPGEFFRSIQEKTFFGGVPSGNFIILNVDSYSRAYAGLLEWELSMVSSLIPFFGMGFDDTLATARFEDQVISNKDTRMAVDETGDILFLYGFYNPTTIIFAKNPEVFREVSDMLLRRDLAI